MHELNVCAGGGGFGEEAGHAVQAGADQAWLDQRREGGEG